MVRQKQGKDDAQSVPDSQPSKEPGSSKDRAQRAVVGPEPKAAVEPLDDFMVARTGLQSLDDLEIA
jgi:hypothetical protein